MAAAKRKLAQLGFRDMSYMLNTGIYVFVYKDEVTYVGKSVNPLKRVGQHKERVEYDSLYFIACDKNELTELELLLISTFKPRFNIAGLTKPRNIEPERKYYEKEYRTNPSAYIGQRWSKALPLEQQVGAVQRFKIRGVEIPLKRNGNHAT